MSVELAMLDEAARDLGITMTSASEGRHVEDDGWEYDRWGITLHRGHRSFTTQYRSGTGHGGKAPGVAEVLRAIESDANAGDRTFEEFCDEFGYDQDSRKAERIWRACRGVGKRIRRFLGDDYRRVSEAAREY